MNISISKQTMRYFAVLLLALIFTTSWLLTQDSEALMLIGDPINDTDVIIVGTIASTIPNYDKLETQYSVNIEEILKGEQYLEERNYAKTLSFVSPGLADPDVELTGTIHYKTFSEDERALLLLNDKNQRLEHSLSRVTTTDCTGEQMMKLYYVPGAGLVLHQDDSMDQPYHTNKPITAQYYYFNGDLTSETLDVVIEVVDDFPDVHHTASFSLNLDECQAYAMAETDFVIEKPGSFAISADGGYNGGGQAYSGIKVVDYVAPPLQQIKSGVSFEDVKCKTDNPLVLIKKIDGSLACVKPETISKLVERGWTTQSIVHDIVMKTMSRNLGPECSQNTMDEIMNGDAVDESCSEFIDALVTKRQSEMREQGYFFDNDRQAWTKDGYPDIMMNLAEYYKQNLNSSNVTAPEQPEPTPLDIANIEDNHIHLNPVDMCASITLELLSPDELEQTQLGNKDVVFLEFDDDDMQEIPVLEELIRATHYIEFTSNDYSHAEMNMRELVDYELFLMEKSMEKYGDSQDDYFMKLDSDLDERLADPKKQGFSNEFIAPQIVYDDKMYQLSHTVFWVADEHEMQSMSAHLKGTLEEDEKFVNLNDEDMESIPKIRAAIEKIGTELESVVAFKGIPEDPDWNNYRDWYSQKGAEQFDIDENNVYVKGFTYNNEYYQLGFPIC